MDHTYADLASRVEPKLGWEVATILVTVKAYPAIGRRNGEAVCVAGVRIDGGQPRWIRLFPVPFRGLSKAQQFKKYQVISLRVKPHPSDHRPESYRPDLESMMTGPVLDTTKGWGDRWELLKDLAGETTSCKLLTDSKSKHRAAPSLGLIKPAKIHNIEVTPNPEYDPTTPTTENEDLFGTITEALQATPFLAKYHYYCLAVECAGHNQSIVDWESGQFARRNLRTMSQADAIEAHKEKFLNQMCSPARDVYFYLGNQHNYLSSFLVLGVFWPPAGKRPADTLF